MILAKGSKGGYKSWVQPDLKGGGIVGLGGYTVHDIPLYIVLCHAVLVHVIII